MKTRNWLPLAMAASLLGTAPALAQEAAKDFPSRPIRMIVPNAPGSSVDTLSRIVGTGLSQVIGQQIVIDNRAGAAGVIGMEIAKNANPDGYTMIAATTAPELEPVTMSGSIPASSSALMTPIWAKPRAPPLPRASATRGRSDRSFRIAASRGAPAPL